MPPPSHLFTRGFIGASPQSLSNESGSTPSQFQTEQRNKLRTNPCFRVARREGTVEISVRSHWELMRRQAMPGLRHEPSNRFRPSLPQTGAEDEKARSG